MKTAAILSGNVQKHPVVAQSTRVQPNPSTAILDLIDRFYAGYAHRAFNVKLKREPYKGFVCDNSIIYVA
jgi:hypothetical protein